ncbi:MAG TPA: alpha-amylase family glycosyl hydrolase [Terriglobia bacterium]|nr:alpha-amylase family glycosyl hydrolase [Terriglobia bacterium]
MEGPRIYNLFPLLAGPLPRWQPHLERARQMEFTWIFLNPIQTPGASGSLYSIADYYGLHPLLIDPAAGAAEQQLRGVIQQIHGLGMKIMMDLVINHTAADSPLIEEHPEWFQRDPAGRILHPGAFHHAQWVSWEDLAAVDNASSRDREALWRYWLNVVRHYAALGIDGFRCDAAYQVPPELWRFLIGAARREFPHLLFFAETLGCTPEQTLAVARSGFDYLFNSSKWWDYTAPWCLEQLGRSAPVVPSVSFPESHDTERLAAELEGDLAAVRQRYVLAALFASGVLIPIGFEYGFRRRLHVVKTRPEDWETPSWDDTEFIRQVNAFKAGRRLWNEDAPWEPLDAGSPAVAALGKKSRDGSQTAVLLLNKDRRRPNSFDLRGVESFLGGPETRCWPHPPETEALPAAGYQVLVAA